MAVIAAIEAREAAEQARRRAEEGKYTVILVTTADCRPVSSLETNHLPTAVEYASFLTDAIYRKSAKGKKTSSLRASRNSASWKKSVDARKPRLSNDNSENRSS
jgi:hypothetical protein